MKKYYLNPASADGREKNGLSNISHSWNYVARYKSSSIFQIFILLYLISISNNLFKIQKLLVWSVLVSSYTDNTC